MDIAKVVFDVELETLLPPLTDEERKELVANVLANGFSDPITVWKGRKLLVDGHNRYGVWAKELNRDPSKAPEIVEREFGSREEVIDWMIHRQLARRNLNAAQRTALALRLKPALEKEAAERQKQAGGDKNIKKPQEKALVQNSAQALRVRDEVAKAAGVSHDTVKKVETVLATAPEPLKQEMLSGQKSVNQAFKETKTAPPKPDEKPPKKPKNGSPINQPFDESKIKKPLGQLVRALDEKKEATGNDRAYRKSKYALGEFNKTLEDWKSE